MPPPAVESRFLDEALPGAEAFPPQVRILLVVMSLGGIALLCILWFEFPALNVRWDMNAYGSIVWFLLGLHSLHLLTDVGDTLVLTELFFTRHAQETRPLADAEENAFYRDFVVASWIPIYLVLYSGETAAAPPNSW